VNDSIFLVIVLKIVDSRSLLCEKKVND